MAAGVANPALIHAFASRGSMDTCFGRISRQICRTALKQVPYYEEVEVVGARILVSLGTIRVHWFGDEHAYSRVECLFSLSEKRITPESGHLQYTSACLLWANMRHQPHLAPQMSARAYCTIRCRQFALPSSASKSKSGDLSLMAALASASALK